MPTRNFGACEETVSDPKIVLKEKGSSITFLNPDRNPVRKIRIDDCHIREGKRCDYLLINQAELDHFVELKGSDTSHAVEQIVATATAIPRALGQSECFGVIVSRKNPLAASNVQQEKKKLRKNHRIILEFFRPKQEKPFPLSKS